MKWIMQRIRRAEAEAADRAWFYRYCAHITDLERTIAFECPACLQADPDVRQPEVYTISQAIRLGLRCYNCRRLLRPEEIENSD